MYFLPDLFYFVDKNFSFHQERILCCFNLTSNALQCLRTKLKNLSLKQSEKFLGHRKRLTSTEHLKTILMTIVKDFKLRPRMLDVIDQTRERVFLLDIQTPRIGWKKRGAAEFF